MVSRLFSIAVSDILQGKEWPNNDFKDEMDTITEDLIEIARIGGKSLGQQKQKRT